MGFSARLTKEGFSRVEGGEAELLDISDVFSLLRLWHWGLESIDENVTLGDLFDLLDTVQGIEALGPMFSTDIRAILNESKKPATKDPNDKIHYVEVYNRIELSHYEEDPENPDEDLLQWLDEDEEEELDEVEDAIADLTGEKKPFKIYDATGDDPITGKPRATRLKFGEMHGKWVGPYHFWREFHGWGLWSEPYEGFFAENPDIDPNDYWGGYSLSLSPAQDLRHYPLRYKAEFEIRDDLYGGNVLVKDAIGITIGEFIHAIFWDLGFYGSPEDRDDLAEDLGERVDHLRAQKEAEEGT